MVGKGNDEGRAALFCFAYSAGEFQVLAVQGAPAIETVHNFCDSYKALMLQRL